MRYTVAMLKKDDSLQLVTMHKGVQRFSDEVKAVEDLQNDGYILESCIMTNKKEVFYKHKLRGRIAEYQNYLEQSHNTLKSVIERYGVTSEVYTQTEKSVNDYRATLRRQIAMTTLRCLELGVPVDDIALDCVFDYNRELEKKC